MKRISLIFIGITLLVAFNNCAKDGKDGAPGAAGAAGLTQSSTSQKSVFTYWNAPGDGLDIDMNGGNFQHQFAGQIVYFQGTTCTCQYSVSGDENAGTVSISSCIYASGPSDRISNQPSNPCDSFPPITYNRASNLIYWCGGGFCTFLN